MQAFISWKVQLISGVPWMMIASAPPIIIQDYGLFGFLNPPLISITQTLNSFITSGIMTKIN